MTRRLASLGYAGWVRAALLLWGIRTAYLSYCYFAGQGCARHHVESSLYILVAAGSLWIWAGRGARVAPVAPLGAGHWAEAAPLAWLAFVAASFALWAPSLEIGLLSDDYVLLHRAQHEQLFPSGGGEFFRPLPLLVWSALARLPGTSSLLHGLNVLLHGCNAYLTYRLARRVGGDRFQSWLSGAVFLCFPAATEPVAWNSGIFDVGMTSAALAFALAIGEQRRRSGVAAAVLFVVVGLGTKEPAIVFPALAAALWWRNGVPSLGKALAGPTLICGVYLGWRAYGLELPSGFVTAPSQYAIKEIPSRLLGTLAVPWHEQLLAETGGWSGTLSAWLVIALLLASFELWRRGSSGLWLSARLMAWSVVSVLPLQSFFFVSSDLRGSRYVYLAAVGWSILLASLLGEMRRLAPAWRGGATIVALAVVAGSAVGVRLQLQPWREASRLRDRVLRSASAIARTAGGNDVVFVDVPENVNGAYVLANGFEIALRAEVPSWRGDASDVGARRFSWVGTGFRELNEPLAAEQPAR